MYSISIKIKSALISALLFFISYSSSFAQTSKEDPTVHAVNGIWADSNSTAFTNGYAIFTVDAHGKLVVTHYVEFNGTPMVEKGIGFCTHHTISYDVFVTKSIPGWSQTGQHVLTLSEDGNTLRGYYKDSKGNQGPLVFKKLYK